MRLAQDPSLLQEISVCFAEINMILVEFCVKLAVLKTVNPNPPKQVPLG